MIKATIKNETKRNIFAKAGAKKIAGGFCSTKKSLSCGVILDQYNLIVSKNKKRLLNKKYLLLLGSASADFFYAHHIFLVLLLKISCKYRANLYSLW